MAFGDGVPDDVRKKRTRIAQVSFIGDIVVSIVLVLFASEIGDVAYYAATLLLVSGMAMLYFFPRLPYAGRQ